MLPGWSRRFVTVGGVGILLVLGLVAVASLPALTQSPWLLVIVAGLFTALLLIARRRSFRPWRWPLVVLLGCWLGLLGWAQLAPGGPAPPAKADPRLIRIVTWNIHCGQDDGPPWQRFDWPARKQALRHALTQAEPDILCVQEARPGQVAFLEQMLPGHERLGVGRDDGRAGGEHCAIFFSTARFERLEGGTFWLEEPIDTPRPGSAFTVKRLCTWVRLRDRDSQRVLRLYNSHFPLTEGARREAARILLEQIAAGPPADLVVVTADFNAPPGTPSRQMFLDAGLADAAALAGERSGRKTFHLYGVPLRSLDGILLGSGGKVARQVLLDAKPDHRFPSDHFGLLADLAVAPEKPLQP